MAVTAYATGTLSSTVGSEDFLANVNVTGWFTLNVDTHLMVAGDVVELRVYQMILTSGTARVVFYGRYDGAQPTDDLIKVSDAIANELTDAQSLRFSLKQTFGTTRDYPWKVLRFT